MPSRHTGSSLVEALFALAIFLTGAGMLASLALAGHRTLQRSRANSIAAAAAAQKIEELRGAPPPGDSPAAALERNESGFCDFLDGSGRAAAPGAAAFTRRWSVLSGARAGQVSIAVRVLPAGAGDASDGATLITVATRAAP
jgi:hypothetical protein